MRHAAVGHSSDFSGHVDCVSTWPREGFDDGRVRFFWRVLFVLCSFLSGFWGRLSGF